MKFLKWNWDYAVYSINDLPGLVKYSFLLLLLKVISDVTIIVGNKCKNKQAKIVHCQSMACHKFE